MCTRCRPLPARGSAYGDRHDGRPVPIETIDGQRLQLRSVSAEHDASGLHASGWVRRDPNNYGLVRAHLHAIALDANGQELQTWKSAGKAICLPAFDHGAPLFFAPISIRQSQRPPQASA